MTEDLFETLADPSRRRILTFLREGERSAGEVVRALGMSQPTVSKHLKVLRDAGFAEVRADATRRIYSLRPGPLAELDAWLDPFRRFWSDKLDGLERYLDGGELTMDGREGAVLRIGGQYEIRFERRLRHPQQKVWDAITGAGAMSQWFDETHMPDPLEVGAAIRFVHAAADMESRGEITALDPRRLIEWDWIGGFGPAARMSFEVLPDGDGSRLILRQQVADPPVTARSMAGWHKCLDRLQAILDGGEPRDLAPWLALFEETYKPKVLAAGITAPQAGAPEPAPKS